MPKELTLIRISVAFFGFQMWISKLIEHQRDLNNVPGNEWVYSNTNYFLLGIVVERATKKTLAEFAAENIFHPLGMMHTASTTIPRQLCLNARLPTRQARTAPSS